MMDDRDIIKVQINEYHKLLEDLQAKNIILPYEFVGIHIEKLFYLWEDYKQQLKHKYKQMLLSGLITHIIIEDTNRRELKASSAKEMTMKANLVQQKPYKMRYDITIKILSINPRSNNKIMLL